MSDFQAYPNNRHHCQGSKASSKSKMNTGNNHYNANRLRGNATEKIPDTFYP